MDARQFDRLTAALAGTTRRRRLLALLATLSLAHALRTVVGVDEAEAAHPVSRVQKRAAKRRDRRQHRLTQQRRQQRRQHDEQNDKEHDQAPGDWFTKEISILLQNPATARSTPHLEVMRYDCPPFSCPVCTAKAVFDIAPGGPSRLFDTNIPDYIVVQINRRHMITFKNPFAARPFIDAWLAGDDDLCHINVTKVLDDYQMDVDETFRFARDAHIYTVNRNDDKSDFKYFTLELASDL
jgi:hypothetical protein